MNHKSVTIVKLKLHDEALYLDNEKFMSDTIWDQFISNATININNAEDQIRQSLKDSETAQQKWDREFMLKTYGKSLPYKENSTKGFKTWAENMREAEIQTINMYYFSVK